MLRRLLSGGGGSFVYAIGYRSGTEGTGQNNLCIGKNAGSTYNGTAANNIFLGHNAGYTGGGDYDNNILIGSGLVMRLLDQQRVLMIN